MSKRYIDADALGIGKADRNAFIVPEYADGWNSAIEIIENAPTADVVEVVRCRECKYFVVRNSFFNEYGRCMICDDKYSYTRPCDSYCSYGERKEE